MEKITLIIIELAVFALAISIHESAHAWMADRCGDPTARYQGRISLNPIRHVDLLGSIVFPVLLAIMGAPVFGWAKPVPVNPYNLRNYRRDTMLVSAAGPVSNLILALAGMVIYLLLKNFGVFSQLYTSNSNMAEIIGIFFLYLIIINIYLAIFNLIPIPPLDGSGILESKLRGNALYNYQMIKPYGFIILMFIIYTGILDKIANPIIAFVMGILRG